MNRILKGCHAQARPESVSIDEQMIPFTGACPFRQYVPLKPNPVGMKNFVLATADGIVLDFEVYQGSKALAAQVLDGEGLGLGALVLKRLTKTVHPGTKVYCDRFFTTTSAAESMLEKQVYILYSFPSTVQFVIIFCFFGFTAANDNIHQSVSICWLIVVSVWFRVQAYPVFCQDGCHKKIVLATSL